MEPPESVAPSCGHDDDAAMRYLFLNLLHSLIHHERLIRKDIASLGLAEVVVKKRVVGLLVSFLGRGSEPNQLFVPYINTSE